MDELQLAFLEVMLTRDRMRSTKDVEAQVAHWLTEGRASRRDLAEARRVARGAKTDHALASALYTTLLRGRVTRPVCSYSRRRG